MNLEPHVEASMRAAGGRLMDAHADDTNVTGAGIGFRFVGGKRTDEVVVSVLVAKKRHEGLVAPSQLLPKTIEVDGLVHGVDVLEAGPFFRYDTVVDADAEAPTRGLPMTAQSVTARYRPLQQGVSVSNPLDGRTAGTLGCFVYDNVDGRVCILTCNHVIGRLDAAGSGETVVQPGVLDGGAAPADSVATFRRSTPLGTSTSTDAAIAVLSSQTNYSKTPVDSRMASISKTHPPVGMVVAGDPYGNNFLTRMDTTFSALNVTVVRGDNGSGTEPPPPVVPAAKLLMNLDKVGRTTGYTSVPIIGYGYDIDVIVSPTRTVRYKDLIKVYRLALPGDSGSVACQGGTGDVLAPLPANTASCLESEVLGSYYNLPLVDDNALSDNLRDTFMSQSVVGRLLISTTYVNAQTVRKRYAARRPFADEQYFARQWYDKYKPLIQRVLTTPGSTDVVTQENLDDARMIAQQLYQGPAGFSGPLKQEEFIALTALLDVLDATIGMNRARLITYMNRKDVFIKVRDLLDGVSTLELTGPVKVYPK